MSVRRVIRQNKQGAKGALQAVLSVHVLDWAIIGWRISYSDWKSFRMEFKNRPYPFYITGTHLEKWKVTSLCRKLALYCCKINNSPLKPVCLIWGFFFQFDKKEKMFFFSVMKIIIFFFIYRGNYFWKSSCLFCHTADFFFNCSIII